MRAGGLARGKLRKVSRGRESDVVDVASKHLNTMGVSVEWFGAIADEMKISRPALYNYVVDRDDLLFKCYSHSFEMFEWALEVAATAAGPIESLDTFLSAASPADAPERAVLGEIDALPEDKQVAIRSRLNALVDRLAAIIEVGVAQGHFRPVDAVIVANAVVGMASWAPVYRRWASWTDLAEGAV